MKLHLKRAIFGQDYTHGMLFVNDEYFCDTLEPHAIDWDRESKVDGKTAIPEGTYRVAMSYSNTFKKFMPYVCEVPNFKGIMFHAGNSAIDTRGCILVGKYSRNGWMTDSYKKFLPLRDLIAQAYAKEDIELTIE